MENESNQPITVLIIDDEAGVRAVLKDHILKMDRLQLAGEASNVQEAVREIHRKKPDLLLLDIEMPGYSGLQLVDFFNPEEITFDIIFITAYNAYAIQAFKVSAFDYLLKPIELEELKESISRLLRQQGQQKTMTRLKHLHNQMASSDPPDKIAISSLDGIDFVKVEEIIYLEADSTYTRVITSVHTFMASKSMGEFESLLAEHSNFFRPHRSYIINFDHIKRLNTQEGDLIVMANNQEVPVSRYRKKDFLQLIKKFKI